MQSKPSEKNERIYTIVKKYSPYYFNKRFGGIQILNKEDKDFKVKPTNMELFKEFANLEKSWAKKHLKIKNNTLIIFNNDKVKQLSIKILSKEEKEFINNYYGIK
jgi:hypothetical protein